MAPCADNDGQTLEFALNIVSDTRKVYKNSFNQLKTHLLAQVCAHLGLDVVPTGVRGKIRKDYITAILHWVCKHPEVHWSDYMTDIVSRNNAVVQTSLNTWVAPCPGASTGKALTKSHAEQSESEIGRVG